MPRRKSGSSDVLTSPKSSLRRLSSLASLQALMNPFNRRRSNNATDNTLASSASNLSLSSTVANAPQPYKTSVTSSKLFHIQGEDDISPETTTQQTSNASSRRGSHNGLSEDPICGMPRSRTFSNLPIPTKARKTTPMTQSKSHYRLPSATPSFARPRSPERSTRTFSIRRTTLTEWRQPPANRRMQRSDTQPVLPVSNEGNSNKGRSTAFKENLSLSPVKPLPPMSMFEDNKRHGYTNTTPMYNRAEYAKTSASIGQLSSDDFARASGTDFRPIDDHGPPVPSKAGSSPVYQPFVQNQHPYAISKPQPAQRWKSQPVLTNLTNLSSSQHGDIQQRRLLSERQPPTPPLPKTPSNDYPRPTAGRLASQIDLISLLQSPDQSPTKRNPTKKRTDSPLKSLQTSTQSLIPAEPVTKPGQVTVAEPTSYWCGRFSSLVDRYRNGELATHLGACKVDSDKMHSPDATTKRMRRALEHLHSMCTTNEARASFVTFQRQLASTQSLPELAKPIGPVMSMSRTERQCSNASETSTTTTFSDARKFGFMDRLLGRSRRSLVG